MNFRGAEPPSYRTTRGPVYYKTKEGTLVPKLTIPRQHPENQIEPPVNANWNIPAGNLEKRSNLKEKLQNLGQFMKAHPVVTAGFVVAAGLLAISCFLAVESILGHSTLHIFKAHPEISAALMFMTINYSITLINICRRVVAKEELENQRRELERQSKENLEVQNKISQDAIKTHQKELDGLAASVPKKRAMLRKKIVELEKKIQRAEKLKRLVSSQTELSPLLSAKEYDIQAGLKKLDFTMPDKIILKAPKNQVVRERQMHQQSLYKKAKQTFDEMKVIFQKSPGSKALVIAGIAMILIAGIATYFWFKGDTKIYLFGSLSVMTIAPAFMYGFSTIYEAYNSAQITYYDREVEEIENESQKKQEFLKESIKKEEVRSSTYKESVNPKIEAMDHEIATITKHIESLAKLIDTIIDHAPEPKKPYTDLKKGTELGLRLQANQPVLYQSGNEYEG